MLRLEEYDATNHYFQSVEIGLIKAHDNHTNEEKKISCERKEKKRKEKDMNRNIC